MTAPLAQDLALAWEVTGGTASAADFIQYAGSGTVTIPARQNSAPILFFPRDDDLVEGSETLTLTFSPAPGTTLPDGVTFGRTTATATIRDSDEAVIDLRVVADVSETDARLTFRPVLSRRLTQDVTLSWEVTGGTASADDFSEYVGSGTVTIEAGRGGAPIRFFPLDDDAVEGAETLEVTISAALGTLPRGVNLGATTTATATIADDDEAPVVNATVGIDDASVAENGGNAEFTVSLTTAVNSAVVLDVIYEGSGDNPVELARDLGAGRPATVTIDRGRTEATLLVPVNNDALVEGDETFTVTIRERMANPLPDGVTIDDGTATGTIVDNETGQVTLGPATLTAAENGEFTYTVSLSRAADDAVTVRWTAATGPGDTATVDDDLRETTGTVTFAARNNRAQTFTIRPVDDPDDEDNETFTVTLEVDTEGNNPLPTGVTIGTTNSSTATITDNDDTPAAVAPAITTQPTDQSVTVGGSATFTVTATGTPTPTYQWRFEGSDISGATSETYTLSSAALTDAGDYTVVVTNTAGTVTSTAATLTVTPAAVAPQITTQPTDQSVTVGENATFTVAATGTPTPTYQWRFEGSDISGATSASYTLSSAALTDAGDYTVVVTNTAGTVTSSAATLTVTAAAVAPQITTQPTDQSVTVGENATFTVAATGTPTPTYQWRFEGSDISGATSASYAISSAALTDAGDYTVVVTNTAGTVTSSAATLTVTPAAVAPQITTQPTDQSVTVGENATFTVAATGTPTPTYQWRFEGSDISGATSASYTLSSAALTDAGDYTVVVTNTAGTVTSTAATLTVTPVVNARVSIADADPVAEGAGPARFTVTLSQAADSDVVLDVAYAADTASLADLGSPRPDTVTIKTGATEAAFAVPIFDDDIVEGEETFTVTLTVNTAPEGVTVADGVATGTIARTPEPSILIEPRRIAAGTALRRHVSRFDSLTGTVTRSRLEARETRRLSGSKDLGDGALAVGGGLGESRWGAWIDGAWAGFDGTASGRQADVYGGVDYLAPGSDWLIGALIGHEVADLEIGEATYRSDYTHLGLYGGARLSERLLFDGAVTYGTATPDIALGDVSASYDARRITARGALTGDFGLEYGLWTGSVKVQPRLGVLYSRERLGAFTDSAGGVAEREILELGRFSAGPRLTWDFDGVRVAGGARVQGDFRGLDDGTGGRLSGAADIGVNLDLTPRVTLGAQGDVDGIGVSDEFGSLGGKVELGVRF